MMKIIFRTVFAVAFACAVVILFVLAECARFIFSRNNEDAGAQYYDKKIIEFNNSVNKKVV